MSHVWRIARFDGDDWQTVGDEYVTEAGAAREAAQLQRRHPNLTFRVQRSRPRFLFDQRIQ